MLKRIYPEYTLDESRLTSETFTKRSAQKWLFSVLCDIFDDTKTKIEENSNLPELKFSKTSQPVELDVFIPSLNIAFEYQGMQHYQDTMVFGLSQQYQGIYT